MDSYDNTCCTYDILYPVHTKIDKILHTMETVLYDLRPVEPKVVYTESICQRVCHKLNSLSCYKLAKACFHTIRKSCNNLTGAKEKKRGLKQSPWALLEKFLIEQKGKAVFILYAGVSITNDGQRSVRLAQGFAGAGYAVIYIYNSNAAHKANTQDCYAYSPEILVIRDGLIAGDFNLMLDMIPDGKLQAFIAEFPCELAAMMLSEVNARNQVTIYDILDDWEDFALNGLEARYEVQIERYLLRNARLSFAVSETLVRKFRGFDVMLLSNGYDPNKLPDQPAIKIRRGRITVGFFGWLTPKRFDWNLVTGVARNNPEFVFHLIGYGMPDSMPVPDNIVVHGYVHPSKLSSYVKSWNVCMLPYLKIKLSEAADPLKVYEYLHFRKPVVSAGVPSLAGVPYVCCSDSDHGSFADAIVAAAALKLDEKVISEYLSTRTWTVRVESFLEAINAVKIHGE